MIHSCFLPPGLGFFHHKTRNRLLVSMFTCNRWWASNIHMQHLHMRTHFYCSTSPGHTTVCVLLITVPCMNHKHTCPDAKLHRTRISLFCTHHCSSCAHHIHRVHSHIHHYTSLKPPSRPSYLCEVSRVHVEAGHIVVVVAHLRTMIQRQNSLCFSAAIPYSQAHTPPP